MKFTISLDSLDSDIVSFYESDKTDLIKDALYHGFKIVTSSKYALNIHNGESTHSDILQQLALTKQQNITNQKLWQQETLTKLEKQQFDFLEEKKLLQNNISELHQYQLISNQNLETAVSQKFQEQISKLEDKNESLTQQILQTQEKERNHYQTLLQQEKLTIVDLQSQLHERNSILSNSSKKGKEGEMRMLDTLNELFPKAEIFDTHKTSENGDFRLIINGIQILYENKNFESNNVPKRDIEKFRRDIEKSDCHGGIMCSENSGIANKSDFDIEIIGDTEKPVFFLTNTNTNIDKIKIAVSILVNILENKLDLHTNTLLDIKEQVKECDTMLSLYNSNKKYMEILNNNNETLVVSSRRIKFRLEKIITELTNQPEENTKKTKERCEYCSKSYIDRTKHYRTCKPKLELESVKNI